ncbi:MAG: ABC transporter ATP-binding protein [Thermaerobacter sp.]|nr:ABC transporter ATP-binding protein [Thermaerobacter sp.]
MNPVIACENLCWQYQQAPASALSHIDLAISPGEIVAIVGPNGSGKTSLLLALRGLIPSNLRGTLNGQVLVDGKALTTWRPDELTQQVGLVFSDPEAQFTSMSVEEEVAFAMENLGIASAQISERIEWAARVTGITPFLDKSPFDLSGGQKQRVAIAAILALRPRVLLLDEPTSMLDPAGKEQVFTVLEDLRQGWGCAVVIAEHDMSRILKYADRLILLDQGRKVWEGAVADFWQAVEVFAQRQLNIPAAVALARYLRDAGRYQGPMPTTTEQAVLILREALARERAYHG